MRVKVTFAAFALLSVIVVPALEAQAVRQTAVLDQDYVFAYPNPCNGEVLTVYTHVRTYTRQMTDGNGGTHFHFNGHWQYRAVSATTGVQWVGSETGNWSILAASGGTTNETYVSEGDLIAKGPADNLRIRTFMKTTVTPGGKPAVEMAYQTVDCRG